MREFLIALAVLTAVCTAFLAAMPWLLRKRNVEMRRTKFGITLVFDAENLDHTPVRLLNVNGTFQSGLLRARGPTLRACVRVPPRDGARDRGARFRSRGEPRAPTARDGDGRRRLLAAQVPGRLRARRARGRGGRIDPSITQIAREFFFLDECLEKTGAERDGRLRLVTGDAWAHVRAAAEPYDVIVNDAFSGNRPLGPLTTEEGARTIREHLAEDGVYLANVRCACEGRRARVLREVEEAFGREFAHVGYVPEWPDEPRKPGNNALVATDAAGVVPAGAVVVR